MKNKLYPIITSCTLVLAVLACNLPGGQSNNQPDLALTITAQAAALQGPSDTPAPVDSAITASPSVPSATVSAPTNCRTGPSTEYDIVLTMNPGQSAEIVGKNIAANYWIIKTSVGGSCWLWGQNAIVSGNTSILPDFPAPPLPTAKFTKTPKPTKTPEFTHTPEPTATLAPPTAPSGLTIALRDCAGGFRGITPIWIETIKLTWQDNADNETGYRLYKNSSPVPDFAANSTEYNITLRYPQGTGGALYDNFGVEAFNSAGSSSRPSIDVPTCP